MKHKSYFFIAYMFAKGRIGLRELEQYEQAGWLSEGEKQKLISSRKEKAYEKYA